MLKRYHHIIGGIFRFSDALVIGVSWLAAYGLRFYFKWFEITRGLPRFEKYAALTPFVIALWMVVFSNTRIYESKRMLRRTDEIFQLLKAHGLALLFFITLTSIASEYRYSRGVIVSFGLVSAGLLTLLRLVLRNALREIRRQGYNLRHVLILGEGEAVQTIIRRMDKFPELGLRTQGILTHEHSTLKEISGKPVIGHFGELRSILKQNRPDQILLALPRSQYTELERILTLIKDEPLNIQLIPDIHEFITLGCEIEDFDGLPLVNLNGSPLRGWGALAKRLTDLVLAFLALMILFPLLVLIALMIKLTSKGPIFYAQERMGLDGRSFQMYKFRSMHADAESASGAVWAKPDDQRRTRLGTFLRSTSLDELPQFWNVFKGEMSLVGPRPERPVFVHQFRHEIPNYMLRHKVKAGITGWAQIHGWRGNTSLDQRIECDLYYIRNWSYFLDLKILFLTLWKGFVNKNAY
ncbi:MAG: undecaprenyl-phosphate glucose phosphotransferase [Bdellovibrionia bacterium]